MTYLTLRCNNCKNYFVWSEEEQELYQKRRVKEPKYCAICRGIMEAREKDQARKKYEL